MKKTLPYFSSLTLLWRYSVALIARFIQIVVNGEEMDLKKLAITSSGGISECKEPLVTTTPLPSTTSRPTYKMITTQTPVAKAHTTTVPVTSCAGGGKFIDLTG